MLPSAITRARDLFAEQFETVGVDIVYRKRRKGPPIRVSAEERDAFVSSFARRSVWLMIGSVIVMLAGSIALAFYAMPFDGAFPSVQFYAGVAVMIVVYMTVHMWLWDAPARALQYRAASGSARSPEEMRTLAFERLTWKRLALAAGAIALLMLNVAGRTDILHGWGRLWLVFAVGFSALVIVQAGRKWRYDAGKKRSAGVDL